MPEDIPNLKHEGWVKNRPEYQEIDAFFSEATTPVQRQKLLKVPLAMVLGPLTVRERWDLLGRYQLDEVRLRTSLEGPPLNVSHSVIQEVSNRLYPTDVMFLKLMADLTDLPEKAPHLTRGLISFFEED